MRAHRASIFASDDLELVELLGKQAALMRLVTSHPDGPASVRESSGDRTALYYAAAL